MAAGTTVVLPMSSSQSILKTTLNFAFYVLDISLSPLFLCLVNIIIITLVAHKYLSVFNQFADQYWSRSNLLKRSLATNILKFVLHLVYKSLVCLVKPAVLLQKKRKSGKSSKPLNRKGKSCLLTRFICQMRRKCCHIKAIYVFFMTEMERE